MAQDFQQRLERAADLMAATTHAVVEGRRAMALIEKMNLLAQRRRELSAKMETRADELLARYDAAPARVDAAFDRHVSQLDAEDAQLREMEDALSKLGDNGPLPGSSEG